MKLYEEGHVGKLLTERNKSKQDKLVREVHWPQKAKSIKQKALIQINYQNRTCVGQESNPGQLLGRQLCLGTDAGDGSRHGGEQVNILNSRLFHSI